MLEPIKCGFCFKRYTWSKLRRFMGKPICERCFDKKFNGAVGAEA